MKKGKSPAPHAAASGPKEAVAPKVARSTTTGGAEIVTPLPREEHCFEIRDAMHVRDAAAVHRAALDLFGLTEKDFTTLDGDIEAAIKLERVGGRLSLDKLRQLAKNLAGDYRSACGLASSTVRGPVPGLLETLKADLAFPDTDPTLSSYLLDIIAPMKEYSEALAKRNFLLDKQAQLEAVAAQLAAALAAGPAERAKIDALLKARERAFENLKLSTQYVRHTGRDALKKIAARTHFDRVDARAPASGAAVVARAQGKLGKAKARVAKLQAELAEALAEEQKLEAELQAKAARAAGKGKRKGRGKKK